MSQWLLCRYYTGALLFSVVGLALPSKLGFNKFVSKLSLSSSDPDPVVLQERLQGLEKYLQVSLVQALIRIISQSIKLIGCICIPIVSIE